MSLSSIVLQILNCLNSLCIGKNVFFLFFFIFERIPLATFTESEFTCLSRLRFLSFCYRLFDFGRTSISIIISLNRFVWI